MNGCVGKRLSKDGASHKEVSNKMDQKEKSSKVDLGEFKYGSGKKEPGSNRKND
jgi:hypothetical protein